MIKESYRKIFIVESLKNWSEKLDYHTSKDLVLTLDYGLKNYIETLGGEVYYLDSLNSIEVLQANNLIFLEFLQEWFLNLSGQDLFHYKGINFGKSFRILFWSELMYFVRLCLSLEEIIKIQYENIILSEESHYIKMSLNELGIRFEERRSEQVNSVGTYFFDIHRYMSEALNDHSLKYRAIKIYQAMYSRIRLFLDELIQSKHRRVCVQVYHPTLEIIRKLRLTPRIQVITSGYVPVDKKLSLLYQRIILSPKNYKRSQLKAEAILADFHLMKNRNLVLTNGRDITNSCYKIIDHYIENKIPIAISEIDAALRFQRKLKLSLNICISSIGLSNTIFHEVCKAKGVESLFIANGLLNSKFGDEGNDFDYINCYSSEMKRNYFSDSPKAIPLGDPRMDAYGSQTPERKIERRHPTIVIGTSGFNSTDFTSYVAIEFEFMSDILSAISKVPDYGKKVEITIKVRPNGYLEQYKNFVREYFPSLNISVIQKISMIDLLAKCDLYISIASQTLFEASCLGIPVIYYKKDREIMDSPFNSKSELPTFHNSNELLVALNKFRLGSDSFAVFQDRKVMEKYIGPLDGLNLNRNLDFIYNLISSKTV